MLETDTEGAIPKLLGGEPKQLLAKIPETLHDDFHDELRKELKLAGFTLPIGGTDGSTEKWIEHFQINAGTQRKAFDAVLNASRVIDEKYGTEITSTVWKNIFGENALFVH